MLKLRTYSRKVLLLACLCASLEAQGADAARAHQLAGVYRVLPIGQAVPDAKRSGGSPAELSLLPFARTKRTDIEQDEDAFKLCQPVGPFRMMATERLKIELVTTPEMVVMLFEDISHGNLRTFHLNRPHLKNPEILPQGDSIAHWDGDTLVVDTASLPDRNWLNDTGARPSTSTRLTERIRPIQDGRILEYTMRVEDPKALAAPYTYMRIFERTDDEIEQDLCEIESHWSCGDLCVK